MVVMEEEGDKAVSDSSFTSIDEEVSYVIMPSGWKVMTIQMYCRIQYLMNNYLFTCLDQNYPEISHKLYAV